MKYFKFAQGTYTKKDFEPKKLFRSPSVKGNGGKNRGKKYYTKRINMIFKQTLLGLTLFCVVIGIIGGVSTYHTKKYNSIMAEYEGFQERYNKRVQHDKEVIEKIKNESVSMFKVQTVKAEALPVEQTISQETTKQAIQRIGKVECEKRGMGQDCVNDLVGMAFVESSFNCNAVGDSGKAHGCFQIHRGYHKSVTVEQARDLNFSIPWTLNRLIAKGYPEFRSASIQMHNGTPNTSKTKAYLNAVNEYIK